MEEGINQKSVVKVDSMVKYHLLLLRDEQNEATRTHIHTQISIAQLKTYQDMDKVVSEREQKKRTKHLKKSDAFYFHIAP